ncbi:MAG TPA: hypothetical protein PK639_04000 [Candidatus Woesebacteria bacterium]|nr:hypothetical protein [Candidatus Woesebacteria bacterium]
MVLTIFGILGICFLVIAPIPVGAQCPVCVVTVGGGMLIAKKLGIDDLLVSIWISALNVAISFWLATVIKTKILKNGYLLTLLMLITTLAYFYLTDQIGVASNTLLGIDKIIFGQIIGTLFMILGNHFYQFVKAKLGHAPFPYAKVVFPFIIVLLVTFLFKLFFHL